MQLFFKALYVLYYSTKTSNKSLYSMTNTILDRFNIQVHLNKLECREQVHFFLLVISKNETFIYFRFSACKVKHFKSFFCFNFDD